MPIKAAVEDLVERGMQTAVEGAIAWAESHDHTRDDLMERMDEFAMALKAEVATAFTEALKDAKDAFSAGMPDVASSTFAATMRLAGINAAKKAFGVTPIS